jgi:hypothetical protein
MDTRTSSVCATAAGRSLIPCVAELGGNAPVLVFADADLAQAVNGVAFGNTCLTGKSHLPNREIPRGRQPQAGTGRKREWVARTGRCGNQWADEWATGGIGLSGNQVARFFSVITGKSRLRSIVLQPNRKWD